MWKKRILCLVLVLCAAAVMTACQQKETFPTTVSQEYAEQPTEAPQDVQNIVPSITSAPQVVHFIIISSIRIYFSIIISLCSINVYTIFANYFTYESSIIIVFGRKSP